MTPEEFARKMEEIFTDYDTEEAHGKADKLMCDLLRKMGYEKGVEIFKEAEKWYA